MGPIEEYCYAPKGLNQDSQVIKQNVRFILGSPVEPLIGVDFELHGQAM